MVNFGFWLSVTDMGYDGSFSWQSTGASLNYTNWALNQPVNTPGQSCVAMALESMGPLKGLWTVQDCNSTNPAAPLDTVCELIFNCP